LVLGRQENGKRRFIAILVAQRTRRSVEPEQDSGRLLRANERRKQKRNDG
jgi:hypothetical protein